MVQAEEAEEVPVDSERKPSSVRGEYEKGHITCDTPCGWKFCAPRCPMGSVESSGLADSSDSLRLLDLERRSSFLFPCQCHVKCFIC